MPQRQPSAPLHPRAPPFPSHSASPGSLATTARGAGLITNFIPTALTMAKKQTVPSRKAGKPVDRGVEAARGGGTGGPYAGSSQTTPSSRKGVNFPLWARGSHCPPELGGLGSEEEDEGREMCSSRSLASPGGLSPFDSAPRGHWATCGDICGCHNWGCFWHQVGGELSSTPQCPGRPHRV